MFRIPAKVHAQFDDFVILSRRSCGAGGWVEAAERGEESQNAMNMNEGTNMLWLL
jgi:hypothetical protein